MLVTFDEGAAEVRASGSVCPFGRRLLSPAATFTPDGHLVAVGKGEGEIYKPGSAGLAFVSRFPVAVAQPLAVLPAFGGEFAAFDREGSVHVYRFGTR
jgi:hypothetical protein